MLTIWGRKTSSNVQALMWCVGELGLPFHRHDAGHRFGGLNTAEFRAMNPNQTIPVLKDESIPPIWETGAIMRYLAARYGSEAFWPADPVQRSNVDKWAEWSKLNVAMAFTAPVFWHVVRTSPSKRNAEAIQNAVATLESKLSVANTQLSHTPFLAGPDFTLADIQLGHILYRYYDIDISRAPLGNLRRYYKDLAERPAFQEHVMISYDELRVS